MRVLLINPNTSEHITRRMAASAQRVLSPGERLEALTAVSGPVVVGSEAQLREADDNALAMARTHAREGDVIVLAISVDRAAPALRAALPAVTVVGMTEAAIACASLVAARVGLLTIGTAMVPLYRDRVAELGMTQRVGDFEAPELAAAFSSDVETVDPRVLPALTEAGENLRAAGCGAIVLAGAVLCGYETALARALRIPVFDGVACAVGMARLLRRG
jgi:allantoin racemase